MYFEVEYVVESDGGVHLVQVVPYCKYVENKFWDGVVLRNVNLEEEGRFLLRVQMNPSSGEFYPVRKSLLIGWVDVPV